MNKPPIYHDFVAACAQAGCPLCRLVGVEVQRALRTMLRDDSLLDPKTRHELRQSLGFCREHTWLLLETQIGNALGISILYEDLLGQVQKGLAQTVEDIQEESAGKFARLLPGRKAHTLQAVLHPRKPCPACHAQEIVEHLALDMLAGWLDEPDLSQALEACSGLCLPHLGQAFECMRKAPARRKLLQISQRQLADLRQELAEFIRKNDYRFRDEPIGAEGNAWKRAMSIAVGEVRRT